ncbi:MAG: hypothetical protein NTZ14_10970 [Hyphomicrobiales bacterium]|nr:hypothetical protein [Hyphomicrobiales bacterium]
MTTACSNAKLDGVQVVTILFRVKTVAAQNLLRNCACSGNLFCIARDQAALSKAFTDVAELIGRIRITK